MAPSITGYTGTWTHGGSVVITGSNFGSKSVAAPVVWDNCDHGQAMSARWDGWYPNETYHTFDTDIMQYSTPIRGVSTAHSNVSKYMRGCGDVGTMGDVMAWKTYTRSAKPDYSYWSWYHRMDPSWSFYNSETPPQDNQKYYDYCAGIIPYTVSGGYETGWYLNYQKAWYSVSDNDAEYQLSYLPDHSVAYGLHCLVSESPFNGWIKSEIEVIFSASGSGSLRQWVNCREVFSASFATDGESLGTRCESVGGYARPYSDGDTQWRYWNDIYFDRSLARVVLGDENVYDNCTIREAQIPTAWASDGQSITVTVNQGALGSTAYPYVVDSNGSVSAAGSQISFGEAEPDPPTGTPVLSVR